jgi:hypothetical protein
VLEALRGFLRHSQPKVAMLAAGVLGALDPLPGELLPYVEETQGLVAPQVADAITELANKLKQ